MPTTTTVVVKEIEIKPFDISELTDTTVSGSGVLDKLLTTLRHNLEEEFDQGRISGSEFAQVFTDLYQATLTGAISYSMSRHKLAYELTNLENEGLLTAARIRELEENLKKIPLEMAHLTAQTEAVTADTNLRLPAEVANLGKQGELLTQQVLESEYRVVNMLPKELEQIDAQIVHLTSQGDLVKAQTLQVTTETTTKIPAEVSNIMAQSSLTTTQKDSVIQEMTKIPVEIEVLQAQKAQVSTETLLIEENIKRAIAELAKTPVEVEILRKQALQIDAETAFTGKRADQITAELDKIPLELSLLEKQITQSTSTIAQIDANTDRVVKETLQKLPIEVANLGKQGVHMDAETALTTNQSALSAAQASKVPVEIEYTQAQIAHMSKQNLILEKDLDLKQGQLLIQIQEIEIAKQNLEISKQELEIKREQIETAKATTASSLAQAKLYDEKVITEKAQTKAGIAEVGSVINLNNQVLQAQSDGYKRDAEQKTAKLFLDTWIASYSDGDREANESNGLFDPNIGKVVAKLLQGINVTI